MKKEAFTLIEMMIAVAIGSMLLVMATPIYNKMVLKSRTQEAKAVIESIVFAQERYKQENGKFYFIDNTEIKNEQQIKKELKISLKESPNFNYTIEELVGVDDGNFTIKAILRDSTWPLCTDTTSSSICKQEGSAEVEAWVEAYNRGESKHYIKFKYPVKYNSNDAFISGGVDYEHLYDD